MGQHTVLSFLLGFRDSGPLCRQKHPKHPTHPMQVEAQAELGELIFALGS